jgi:2-hydroxychromene-2-carboxylate isomerase
MLLRTAVGQNRMRLRRGTAELWRRLAKAPHRVEYFHQVDDPYSHLAAQALSRLTDRYEIELVPHLVAQPTDAATPEREMLTAYARRDAAAVAPHFEISFQDPGRQPQNAAVRRTERALAAALAGGPFAELAPRLGEALWSGREDPAGLATPEATAGRLAEGSERRKALGHYLGATFHYGGEWYWGIDRLGHLEKRLAALGACRTPGTATFAPPSEACEARGARELTLEYFPSLRSPYTYISMPRVFSLAEQTGVKLVLRPVLPMVMRGLSVPMQKGLYIFEDTAREAQRVGLPFGRVVDPVGRPVERAYSLFPWAREQGRAAELLLGFARGAFAEGIDTGSDTGIRKIVEGAGLGFEQARGVLDSEDWRGEIGENQQTLYALGLWGVPSFRLRGPVGSPDFSTWGQDRIFLLSREIARRTPG